MNMHILISSVLLVVTLRNMGSAGAIKDRRSSGANSGGENDGPSMAKAPGMSVIHFPEPQDALSPTDASRNFLESKQQRWESASSRSSDSPVATPVPVARPLLDEDKLIQFEASGEKNERPTMTQSPPSVKPVNSPPSAATAQEGFDLSQLSEILKGLLNSTQENGHSSTVQPIKGPATTAGTPTPSSTTADTENEFKKFLPHLQEALLDALLKQASRKHTPPKTTPHPPPSSPEHTEDIFKAIIPALEGQIGSILENSKDEDTASVIFPTKQPIQSVTGDDGQHFSEFLPLLEEALKETIVKGEQEVQSTIQQYSTQSTNNPMAFTTSLSPLSTNSTISFEDFLPELQHIFSGIVLNAQLEPSNWLATETMHPSATQKSLPPLSSGRLAKLSTEHPTDPLEGSEYLIQALESSLADILNEKTSQTPASLQEPAEIQTNLVIPQPKIVYELNKYYPQLKKVLDEIVREKEEEAISKTPVSQLSQTFDNVEDQGSLHALYKTVRTMFSGYNVTGVASPSTVT